MELEVCDRTCGSSSAWEHSALWALETSCPKVFEIRGRWELKQLLEEKNTLKVLYQKNSEFVRCFIKKEEIKKASFCLVDFYLIQEIISEV